MNIPAKSDPSPQGKSVQATSGKEVTSQTLYETAPRANGFQKKSSTGFLVLLGYILLVLVPSGFATIYYYFVASDIYVSEMRLIVKNSGSSSASASIAGGLMGTLGRGAGSQDLNMVAEYLHSNDLMEKLTARVPLREIYSNPKIDSLARLPAEATQEDFKAYFEDFVVIQDDGTGTLEVKVKAFTAEEATMIALELVDLSEIMVDQVSFRAKQDSIKFAERELEKAKDNYLLSARDLTEYRNNSQFVDPNVNAVSIMTLVANLETQIAEARTDMAQMKTYLADSSPQVAAIKSKIAALQKEKNRELSRLGSAKTDDVSEQLEKFEALQLFVEVNRKIYEDTLVTLDAVRNEAARQNVYLVPFVPPSFPDESTEPLRLKEVLSIFVGLSIIYGLFMLIGSAIHEHVRT